jgi:hypothetical protein
MEQQLEAAMSSVMEQGRFIQPAPDLVRARLLARARATVAASNLASAPVPMPATPARWRGLRVAFAGAVVLSLAAAGAMAALRARAPHAPEILPTSIPSSMASSVRHSAPELSPVAPMPTPSLRSVSNANSRHPSRSVSARESYAAELELLKRAQSRYASRDFSDALVLIAEHARRFPNGRLAEEREALRVRSLAGAGRADERRRAFTAFAKRFPHSALLPRLQETAPGFEE